MLACWDLLLRRLTEHTHLALGVAYDGRTYAELEDVLGLLTKYLPFEHSIGWEASVTEYVTAIGDIDRELHQWQAYFSDAHLSTSTDEPITYAYGFDFTELEEPINCGDVTLRSTPVKAVSSDSRCGCPVPNGLRN